MIPERSTGRPRKVRVTFPVVIPVGRYPVGGNWGPMGDRDLKTSYAIKVDGVQVGVLNADASGRWFYEIEAGPFGWAREYCDDARDCKESVRRRIAERAVR